MLGQFSIKLLLNLRRPTLLEDLDKHQLIRALQAQICVLADDFVGFVLGDDLDGGAGLVQEHARVVHASYEKEKKTISLMVRWDKRHT